MPVFNSSQHASMKVSNNSLASALAVNYNLNSLKVELTSQATVPGRVTRDQRE